MVEEKNLEYTIKTMQQSIQDIKEKNAVKQKQIDEIKQYLAENKDQIADDEIIKVYGMVDKYFEQYELSLKQLNKLEKLLPNPYFGKITYKENGDKEEVYIGLADIVDTQGNSIVSDWRAPISALYYTADKGKTFYTSPAGEFEVDLIGKRQISIKDGKLIYYYDTDEKINDELLVKVLMNQKSSASMKNIVSSIQKEQNTIIRQPIFSSVIVLGVAGSGKTSVAMHRLAYLLYSSNGQITNDNILIISPNELFTTYLSTLLPELGEENALALSFRTLLSEHYAFMAQAETRAEMLEDAFSSNSTRLKEIQFKYGEDYAEKVFDFLASINVEEFVKEIYVENKTIELAKLEKKYSLSHENRFRIYRKIDYIIDEIIEKYFNKLGAQKQQDIEKEIRDQIVEELLACNLFNKFMKSLNLDQVNKNNLKYDDIATYAFILFSITGFKAKHNYKEVFVDEVQDYDALSLKMLKELLPEAKFILVGDIKQNLISTNDNINYIKQMLPYAQSFTLSTCYRSTTEITSLANAIIDYKYSGSFVRHGEKPKLYITKDIAKEIQNITQNIKEDEQFGIICKTAKQAKELSDLLPGFALINNESMRKEDLENRKIITTIHLSKGLEFDNVIIPFVSSDDIQTLTDKQLLYVMITRGLQTASFVLSENKDSELLNEKYKDLIEIIKK